MIFLLANGFSKEKTMVIHNKVNMILVIHKNKEFIDLILSWAT